MLIAKAIRLSRRSHGRRAAVKRVRKKSNTKFDLPREIQADERDVRRRSRSRQEDRVRRVGSLEHATRCPDNEAAWPGAPARAALTCRALTVNASVSVSDIDAVRSVLQHRALCPWARPRGCPLRPPSRSRVRRPHKRPCALCCLLAALWTQPSKGSRRVSEHARRWRG